MVYVPAPPMLTAEIPTAAAIVRSLLIVYVPSPPVPVRISTIVVPAVMPMPEIFMPTCRDPDVTTVTVRVVPDIVPVTAAVPYAVIVVKAVTSVPVRVWPVAIVPVTDVTRRVVPDMVPTIAAEGVLIEVPNVTPVPEIVMPWAIVPDVTDVTVRV